MKAPCRFCEGTGQEAPLGRNGYGIVYAGVCSRCGGSGFLTVAPPVKADPLWYLTPSERCQLEADNLAAQADRDAYLDTLYFHHLHAS